MHRMLSLPGRLPCTARAPLHNQFIGPRFLVYAAALEMHPAGYGRPRERPAQSTRHRAVQYHEVLHKGVPEGITITDNAIIPLKERVVDEHFDPLRKLFRFSGNAKEECMQFELKSAFA